MGRLAMTVVALTCVSVLGSASALPPPLPVSPRTSSKPAERRHNTSADTERSLQFEQTEVSFGEVSDEAAAVVEFVFVNRGDEAVKIKNVKPSCGCTTTELEKTVYQPGERGVIRATFNPERRQGEQHKAVTVYSNDPGGGVQRLMVTGYVRPIAYVEPSIINFAQVRKGVEATKTIRVLAQRGDFEITKIETAMPELFGAEIVGTSMTQVEGADLRQIDLKVRMKGLRKAGRESGYIQLHTNDERRPILAVQAVVMVNSELAFESPMVTVGRISLGDTFQDELVLRHTEHRPFKIVSVVHEGASFKTELEWAPIEGEDGAYRIRVRGESLLASRGFRDKLIVTTDLDDESPVEAYFAGMVTDADPDGAAPGVEIDDDPAAATIGAVPAAPARRPAPEHPGE